MILLWINNVISVAFWIENIITSDMGCCYRAQLAEGWSFHWLWRAVFPIILPGITAAPGLSQYWAYEWCLLDHMVRTNDTCLWSFVFVWCLPTCRVVYVGAFDWIQKEICVMDVVSADWPEHKLHDSSPFVLSAPQASRCHGQCYWYQTTVNTARRGQQLRFTYVAAKSYNAYIIWWNHVDILEKFTFLSKMIQFHQTLLNVPSVMADALVLLFILREMPKHVLLFRTAVATNTCTSWCLPRVM